MGFREHLESVVNTVEGSVVCSLMGFDGIAVETYQPDNRIEQAGAIELPSALIEFGNVLSQLKGIASTLKTGSVDELSVNSEKIATVMRMVNQEYYVVLAMLPEALIGKGRYALRLAAPKLAKEL